MVKVNSGDGRVITVKRGIPGSRELRLRSVRTKKISDYLDVTAPYLEVVKNYANPLLMGPPICDELVALVAHMFTEEEASLVQHIKSPMGKTAAAVAVAEGRPVEEVRPILKHLAEKGILLSFDGEEKKRYRLMPIAPGVFEMVLVRTSLDTLTDWHRRFAELFESLYETGYFVDYAEHPVPGVRYLPVRPTLWPCPRTGWRRFWIAIGCSR
jgi:hypothetical protein